MHKFLVTAVGLFLLPLNSTFAIELDQNINCGPNDKCIIVDTVEVKSDIGVLRTVSSSSKVDEAWKVLTKIQQCADVADVVVGGSGIESGMLSEYIFNEMSPTERYEKSGIPGGFAAHLLYKKGKRDTRCTIVVNYSMSLEPWSYAIYLLTEDYFDSSVELGRRALSVVLNRLAKIRRSAGKTDPIRIWGHSKGAAIVESLWSKEAKNGDNQLTDNPLFGTTQYIDACPLNNCYYYGFGYPYAYEMQNDEDISTETANLWTLSDPGWMKSPGNRYNQWYRLTTFTNLHDPVYTCNYSDPLDNLDDMYNCHTAAQQLCHRYTKWLDSIEYPTGMTNLNLNYNSKIYLGDQCD